MWPLCATIIYFQDGPKNIYAILRRSVPLSYCTAGLSTGKWYLTLISVRLCTLAIIIAADYSLGDVNIQSVKEEKDVGIIIHQTLKSSQQCVAAANSAIRTLGMINRTFVNKHSVVGGPPLPHEKFFKSFQSSCIRRYARNNWLLRTHMPCQSSWPRDSVRPITAVVPKQRVHS